MAKLKLLQGLPASGKSTRAKEIVGQGNWIRVNRDLLRTMLHFDKWTGKNEAITVEAEKSLVLAMLWKGKNVVVDDCNLGQRNIEMWKSVVDAANTEDGVKATFEIERIETHWFDCIKRDLERENSVGKDVILNMAIQHKLYEKPAKGFVVCDLDGTLCDISHRLHYVKRPEGEKKDWKSFFEEIGDDDMRKDTYDRVAGFIKDGYEVILVSARPDTYRKATKDWLKKYPFFQYTALLMRRGDDKRPDTEVKKDIYERYLKGYKIHKVIDDRPSVIRMWREQGLDVIDVGGGVEF